MHHLTILFIQFKIPLAAETLQFYKTKWIPHTFKDNYRFIVTKKINGDYVWQKMYNEKKEKDFRPPK
jgi:hypothetical protein